MHAIDAGLQFHGWRTVFAALALVLTTAGCRNAAPETARPTAAASRPNIVLILADDAGYGDLSLHGQQWFATPNIDRLAREGLRFTQHYAGSTVCAPSRSSLMTGLHTGHTYIRGNREIQPEGQEPLPDSIYTLAEMLQDAGYVTGAFGKWGLGYPGSEGDPLHQGFDRFFGYNCQRLAHNYYPESLWDDRRRVTLPGNTGAALVTYAPDLIHAQTLAFIEENRHRPFFLFIPTPLPHAELVVPRDTLYRRLRAQIPEDEPYDGADYGDEGFRTGAYGSQEAPRAAHAAMMTRMDRHVGEVLDKLDALGLRENTIVLFASDNGPHYEGGGDPAFFRAAGPFRGRKRDLYEGGIRVPMVVRWPGTVAAGRETDHVSAFWDVMPTLAEVAGAAPPDRIDGISFVPTLLGREGQRRHGYLYWEFHERGGRRAVRQGRWKAVQHDVGTDPGGPVELYDLAADPGETVDLASAHPEVVGEMKRIMEEARTPSPLFNFGRTDARAR